MVKKARTKFVTGATAATFIAVLMLVIPYVSTLFEYIRSVFDL